MLSRNQKEANAERLTLNSALEHKRGLRICATSRLSCISPASRRARPLPSGCTGHVAVPNRSILCSGEQERRTHVANFGTPEESGRFMP
jgi:hypothetical protein